MTKLFILLTACLLFGHPTFSVGQPGKEKAAGTIMIYQHCCEQIIKTGPCLFFTGDHNGKMRFRLMGIYTHGATLFFWLRLNNRSSLDYDVDSIRFCVAGSGRTGNSPPEQQRASNSSLLPVYIYDSAVTVPGYRRATTIYALPRFILPPGRQLQIIVRERHGRRTLQIQTNNSVLERARRI